MYISECKSKYYSCLIFEIIWVCEVGLNFVTGRVLWSSSMLGSAQPVWVDSRLAG